MCIPVNNPQDILVFLFMFLLVFVKYMCVWLSMPFGMYLGVWLIMGTDVHQLGKWWGQYQFQRDICVSNVFASDAA